MSRWTALLDAPGRSVSEVLSQKWAVILGGYAAAPTSVLAFVGCCGVVVMSKKIVTDSRKARIWNRMNKGEDFYPIHKWPLWAQILALKEHRGNSERYSFFFFLTSNGLSPDIAGSWTLLYDVQNGLEITAGYSLKAHRQVLQMKKQIQDGKFFLGEKKVFDMHLGYVVTK